MTKGVRNWARRSISLVRSADVGDDHHIGPRLGIQVLVAFLLVMGAAGGVAAVLGFAVGPSMFREHIGDSLVATPKVAEAINRAYGVTAMVVTLLCITSAFAIASLASVLIARTLAVAVANLSEAAALVQSGRYDFAIQARGLGPELAGFADSFNQMAGRLNAVEATRRRLLSDLAHEIRTPIATLDGYLEAFEDGIAEPDPETLAMLRQQTKRMSRLVADVSSISRTEEHQLALEKKVMTVPELVHTCVAAARPRYDTAGIALTADVASGLPLICVDRERMEQVIGNLLDNALRHSDAGGRVIVSATPGEDDWVYLSVSDTGTGIPADHLPHIFERFYRVDSARDRHSGGSGIGLSIVRALVSEHNGTVTVTSQEGEGTTFVVALPPSP